MEEKQYNEILKLKKSAQATEDSSTHIIKEYLVVQSGVSLYAIQLEYLCEVFDIKNQADIIDIPFTPDYLLGIINIRGEIIPVLSLSHIVGNITKEEFNKMVLIEENIKFSFPVVDVRDLVQLNIKEINEVKTIQDSKQGFISGEFDLDEERVFIIDILKLSHSTILQ